MTKNIHLYICSGCRIGECIDTKNIAHALNEKITPEHIFIHEKLCSAAGIDLITRNIKEQSPEAIAIAACSYRHKSKEFDFGNDVLTERINLREGVAWCQEQDSEDSQMMAEDYVRMGIARIENILNPEPYLPEQINKDVLVLGAGVSGMTAAKYIAGAGYRVKLVEKSDHAGGYAAKLYKKTPQHPPWDHPEDTGTNALIESMKATESIDFLLNTEVKNISGEPGNFEVGIENGKKSSFKAGAIVLATGWQAYDATKLSKYHYEDLEDVITNIEFEEMFVSGKVEKLSDHKMPQKILFVQCAGSRDPEHLPYCSNFCCITTLKQARYIRELNPESEVYIIYKDIRSSGHYEYFYQELQKDEHIFFAKGEVHNITKNEDHLQVHVSASFLGDDVLINSDLVVLATGMCPSDSDALKLNYRLGKGLPELQYDFPDSHFICFPYESRRTGIYAAGTARAPMDIQSSMEDAAGAALKAIQCIEATARGEAVHPRSGDRSWPQLYMQRCTDCKRCTEECPFGAYDENEKGTPIPNPARCRRCGICLGACPERVISFADFNITGVSAMIKAVHIPDEFEEKPRILVFLCENDAYPAFDMAAEKSLKYSPFIRVIPVRCLGSVNKIWISDALSQGFDGILQIGCKPGDNYQCHYIHGSELTEKRGENLQEVLEKMMLEAERIKTVFIEINEYDKVPDIINDYVEEIELIGPNPFKDM